MRPIDIARKLGISTSTIRAYEKMGLIPPVTRSASGYRTYTEEHVAYFTCIREMLPGFNLTIIAEVMRAVMAEKIDTAYWIINKAQVDLRQEKIIAGKIIKHLTRDRKRETNTLLTIHELSQETGIPATTIRYWDRVGLITARRHAENNYRLFTSEHIRQLLALYTLKLSALTNRRRYFVDRIREEMRSFDYSDQEKIRELAVGIARNINRVNRLQMRGIAALYQLCMRVESKTFG